MELALAGDTMLGRGVAQRLAQVPPSGESAWITSRFRRAGAAFGTDVDEHAGRLGVDWSQGDGAGRVTS